MKVSTYFLIGFAGLALFFGVFYFTQKMNVETRYNELSNQYEALRVKEANFHDELWKTIAQTAKVDVANDSMQLRFFDAWENGISGSATVDSKGGMFPLLFQQAGLSVNNEIKLKLAQIIDDKNSEFTMYRNDIAAACLELNNYVTNSWNRLFLSGEQLKKIECKTITSTRTKTASETGVDDAGGNVY